jgi:hypothetical protein
MKEFLALAAYVQGFGIGGTLVASWVVLDVIGPSVLVWVFAVIGLLGFILEGTA